MFLAKWIALALAVVFALAENGPLTIVFIALWFVAKLVDDHAKSQFRKHHPEY